ncbi:DnaD domain-containing protein [Metabacillus litoralis]|uniref:DnaD domain-containing protein n=1 Tax=Metabacillus litoralis TaxID=152268 RepID=UPI00203AFABE|nr:DnaD domain protein [Metabacillus litoralis]MCM3409594.1 DnaD domain protein [Metabacillus litoralis]
MAKFRMILTGFWRSSFNLEKMSSEDKLFYVYLLTNDKTTQIGIYEITKKEMALELDYTLEEVEVLLERFTTRHKLIRYNPETCEIAIKNWGKNNLHRGGKPIMDCITKELKEVKDTSLISYVCEGIEREEIVRLYEPYCHKEVEEEMSHKGKEHTYSATEQDQIEENSNPRVTETREEKQSSKDNSDLDDDQQSQKSKDINEIIEFWDSNGFGLSNINAKHQLLSWLDNSCFLHPKDVVLKAMGIACANNKRKLNYIVGILKNWKNESLLTIEEIDSYQDNQPSKQKSKQSNSTGAGRPIPSEFVLDLTAGED